MSSTITKYIIIAFITENYSSKFTSTSFCAPALKSPAEKDISEKSQDTSLICLDLFTFSFNFSL